MQRQTFERALHAWDEWHKSIEKSRKKLGYDPGWPVGEAITWVEKHYPSIKAQGQRELERLEIPPPLQQYWEDCFYSDYREKDGRINYSKITRRLTDQKSLPELPCEHGLVWQESDDINSPWLPIEIRLHERFATKEFVSYAARYAYELVESRILEKGVEPHPICQWLKGGRAPASEELALECVRLKDDLGWTYAKIGKHFGWPLQIDSYGNRNQCSTARYYVVKGRKLRKSYQP